VIQGQFTSVDLKEGGTFTTVSGTQITFGPGGRSASVTDARGNTYSVLNAAKRTLSGTLFVIDGVLLPAP